MIQILPLRHMPEVVPGDDLAGLLAAALQANGLTPQAGDVIVVTQKIVSKAEDRFVNLAGVTPSAKAVEYAEKVQKDPRLIELALQEASAVVRTAPNVFITRHRLGHVMANSGIDASNIGKGDSDRVLLLPQDPDASARQIGEALTKSCGASAAIVISDSFGRPWRNGVVNVAIGAHGVESLIDRRGELDRDGRALLVTQVAAADMLASAAGLVSGEGAEGIPAVLIRGYKHTGAPRPAAAIIRPPEEDLFR